MMTTPRLVRSAAGLALLAGLCCSPTGSAVAVVPTDYVPWVGWGVGPGESTPHIGAVQVTVVVPAGDLAAYRDGDPVEDYHFELFCSPGRPFHGRDAAMRVATEPDGTKVLRWSLFDSPFLPAWFHGPCRIQSTRVPANRRIANRNDIVLESHKRCVRAAGGAYDGEGVEFSCFELYDQYFGPTHAPVVDDFVWEQKLGHFMAYVKP